MAGHMLAINLKPAEKVDWSNPLLRFIANEYSNQEAEQFKKSVTLLEQMRMDIANAKERSAGTRDLYWKYAQQLLIMNARFPISETGIKVYFGWRNTFDGSKLGQYSVAFELASVLFNYGATLSFLGAQDASRLDDAALKTAAHSFQHAAGVFVKVKEEILGMLSQGHTFDLTQASLEGLSHLMLAQAQECVYRKSVAEGKSHNIVSMLASQVAHFYESALLSFESHKQVKKATEKLKWMPHIRCHAAFFKAESYYRTGLVQLQKEEYGSQVGYLTAAVMQIDATKRLGFNDLDYDSQQRISQLSATIHQAFTAAEKDNDTIYHEPVGDAPLTEGRAVVKPQLPMLVHDGVPCSSFIEYGAALVGSATDFFSSLAPMAVHRAHSEYMALQEQRITAMEREAHEETALCDSTLASLGLPASLEALHQAVGLPQGLKEKIGQARVQSGGVAGLSAVLEDIRERFAWFAAGGDFSVRCQGVLDAATKSLDEEENDDRAMRAQFHERWRTSKSADLTVNVRQELKRHTEHLAHSRRSDQLLRDRFDSKKESFGLLEKTPSELDALVPITDAADVNANIVSSLKKTLSEITHMKADRMRFLKELHQAAAVDNITSVLLKTNLETGKQAAFQAALAKYDPFTTQLGLSLARQRELLEEVSQKNGEFEAARAQDENSRRKQEVLQELEVAATGAEELYKNLREGAKFYRDIEPLLETTQRKCDDFIVARRMQRQDLLSELTGDTSRQPSAAASGYPGASSTAQAPYNPTPTPETYNPTGYQSAQAPPGAPSAPPVVPPVVNPVVPPKPVSMQAPVASPAVFKCFQCQTTLSAPPTAPLVQCPVCQRINKVNR